MENNFNCNLAPQDLPEEVKKESKHLSFVFFTFAISYLVTLGILLSINAFLYAADISPKADYIIRSILSASHTPLIFFAMHRAFKKIPSAHLPVADKMTALKLLNFLSVCIFLMISGSIVGNYVTKMLSAILGISIGGIVSDVVKSMKPLEVFILAVILGPIFEELVFRKLLLDKLSRYGTVFASVVSGLVFGLYHGNFEQFFYAFLVGMVLSYIYCVYGKITYPIIIHIILNAIGSFIPLTLGLGETTQITLPQMLYLYIYIFSFLSGAAILALRLKYVRFYISDGCLIRPWKILFKNMGFICTVIISILMFVYNLM